MKFAQLFTLAGLVIATSGYSSATTLSYYGYDPLQSASIWMDVTYLAGDLMLNGQTASSQTKTTEQLTVGVMSVGFDGSLQLRDAFCVDRFAYIGTGDYNVNLAAPNTVTNGERAAWMLHDVLPQINAAPNVIDQQQMAAALQLAIWDVVHDGGDGFSLGRIQMSSALGQPTDPIILSLAQSFVTQSTGHAYSERLRRQQRQHGCRHPALDGRWQRCSGTLHVGTRALRPRLHGLPPRQARLTFSTFVLISTP